MPSFSALTAGNKKLAPYLAVHVDHLRPGARPGFEDARRVWLGVLAAHHTTDGRGLFLQTGDGGFLSVVPQMALGELDAQRSLAQAALAEVDPADQRRYDEASDKRLAPPHRSEIWRYEEALSYGTTDPLAALAGAAWGKMIVEELDPTPAGDDYDDAWREVKGALTTAGYPLVKVVYVSTYGSGDLVSFWLSRSQKEFLETKPIEQTVADTLGRDAAERLFVRMRHAVASSDSIDVIPRPDLSSEPLHAASPTPAAAPKP